MKKGKRVYDPHLKKFVYIDQLGKSRTTRLNTQQSNSPELKKSVIDSSHYWLNKGQNDNENQENTPSKKDSNVLDT